MLLRYAKGYRIKMLNQMVKTYTHCYCISFNHLIQYVNFNFVIIRKFKAYGIPFT
jgi:hypothetical protein